jgi:hypothetical protein
MRSLWNPNRFLRSISPAHWGNPQPTRAFKNRMVRSFFNSTNTARRKVKRPMFPILKSRA